MPRGLYCGVAREMMREKKCCTLQYRRHQEAETQRERQTDRDRQRMKQAQTDRDKETEREQFFYPGLRF